MLEVYRQNFSPEAQAREQMAQQQVLAAQYGNEESLATRELRQRMLGIQADQSQFNLQRDQQMTPLQLEQLRGAIGAQALGNVRDMSLMPFVVPEAQVKLQDMQTRSKLSQQGAPYELERMKIENQYRQGQVQQMPLDNQFRQTQIDAARQQMQESQQMLPIQRASGLASINQHYPTGQPPVTPDMVMQALQGQLVDDSMYQGQGGGQPQAPPASSPFEAAYKMNLIPKERIGQVLQAPAPGSPTSTPQYHSLFSQMQGNMSAYPQELQDAYRYMNDPSVSPHVGQTMNMFTPEVQAQVRAAIEAQMRQEQLNKRLNWR